MKVEIICQKLNTEGYDETNKFYFDLNIIPRIGEYITVNEDVSIKVVWIDHYLGKNKIMIFGKEF